MLFEMLRQRTLFPTDYKFRVLILCGRLLEPFDWVLRCFGPGSFKNWVTEKILMRKVFFRATKKYYSELDVVKMLDGLRSNSEFRRLSTTVPQKVLIKFSGRNVVDRESSDPDSDDL
jgi:hypothetical protein